ncbi:unnamed protein product, partial [marine sediment metagenome]
YDGAIYMDDLIPESDPAGIDAVLAICHADYARGYRDFKLKLCIAHMGGNFHYRALVLAEKHDNVFLDTAFLPFFCARMLPRITPEELIAHAVGVLGAEKVLYGSEGLIPRAVLEAGLAEEAAGLVLGGNACRLLDIDRQPQVRGR